MDFLYSPTYYFFICYFIVLRAIIKYTLLGHDYAETSGQLQMDFIGVYIIHFIIFVWDHDYPLTCCWLLTIFIVVCTECVVIMSPNIFDYDYTEPVNWPKYHKMWMLLEPGFMDLVFLFIYIVTPIVWYLYDLIDLI